MTRKTIAGGLTTVTVFGLVLAGCASMSAQGLEAKGYDRLSGDELAALHAGGASTRWSIYGGASGTATYREDGSAVVMATGETFSGRWRIEDDQLCSSYQGLRGGAQRCYSVYGNGGPTYELFHDGAHYASMTY